MPTLSRRTLFFAVLSIPLLPGSRMDSHPSLYCSKRTSRMERIATHVI